MTGPYDDLDPDEASTSPASAPGTQPGTDDGPTSSGPPVSSGVERRAGTTRRRRPNEPGALTALMRGGVRRCPRCGGGRLFESWFRIGKRCPRCGLRLEREEGGFLGAMTINYVVTAVAFLVLLVVWLVVDLPDVQVLRLTIAAIGVALVVPLLIWPFSKTVWAAVDYLVYRSDPDYVARDAADRASGNGGTP